MIFSPGSELLLLLLLLRLRLVVVLSLWLRVPRMDWDCWGWSWRRADTGTTDSTGTTTLSLRIGAVRYGTRYRRGTKVSGVELVLSRCSWVPLLANLELAGS